MGPPFVAADDEVDGDQEITDCNGTVGNGLPPTFWESSLSSILLGEADEGH